MSSAFEPISLSPYAKNIAGLRSGKLIARYPTGKKTNGNILWYCECDCGGFKVTSASGITSKYLKSCGCEKDEVQQIDFTRPLKPVTLNINSKNIVGLRSGKLVARYPVGKSPNGHALWYCECDCGEFKVTRSSSIISNYSKSCGCANAEIQQTNANAWKDKKRPSTITENNLSFIRDDEIDGYRSSNGHYKICMEFRRWQVYGIDNNKDYELFKDRKLKKAVKRTAAIEESIHKSGTIARWPIFKLLEQGC